MTLISSWNAALLSEGRVTDAEVVALEEASLEGLGACGAPAASRRAGVRRDLDAILGQSRDAYETARAAFYELSPEQSAACALLPSDCARSRTAATARQVERAAALEALLNAKATLAQAEALDHRLSARFWTGPCGH